MIIEPMENLTKLILILVVSEGRPAKQVAVLNGEIFTTLNKKEVVEISVVSDVGPNITWIDETSYTWERTVRDNLKFNYTSFIIAENLSDFGTYGVQICNNNCCIIKFIHLKQMINPGNQFIQF